MFVTFTAVYDGEGLRPEAPLDLKSGARYSVTIQTEPIPESSENAWNVLERLAGTVDAPPDWSLEHDHYLYGTPKRYSQPADES